MVKRKRKKFLVDEERLERILSEGYKDALADISNKTSTTLRLDYNLLESYYSELVDELPYKYENLIGIVKRLARKIMINPQTFNVVIDNYPSTPIPEIHSSYATMFVQVEGVIRKRSSVKNVMTSSVWKCKHCGGNIRRDEEEQTINKMSSKVKCTHCDYQAGWTLDKNKSEYDDVQVITIQENIEDVKNNQQPSQISGHLTNDMVNLVKPGDKVLIQGVVHIRQVDRNKNLFKEYLQVSHVEHLEQQFEDIRITEGEERRIRKLSEREDLYEVFRTSVAPSIQGYDNLKDALVLYLFGASSHTLEDGTRLRGDIHILIIGDPGIGKSQILKHVADLAPRGIYTSGKSASSAGLTAAAVKDDVDGWTIDAGALVLGDGGNVCIDELDKMRSEDRSAIHEALEQQTVSIAKAGIITTLNSRCSVLAAANPKQGRFDRYGKIADQINLPAPILSRFDLTFIVQDTPNLAHDTNVATHMISLRRGGGMENNLSTDLLKKYVSYAKRNINPEISRDAETRINSFYVNMRNQSAADEDAPLPITPRQMEAIIRLSEANARLRLSPFVTVEDAERAIQLHTACLKEVGTDPATGRVDVDVMEGRTSKNERDKQHIVLECISELCDDFGGQVGEGLIIRKCSDEHNMGEDETRKMLELLYDNSMILKPVDGTYKVV